MVLFVVHYLYIVKQTPEGGHNVGYDLLVGVDCGLLGHLLQLLLQLPQVRPKLVQTRSGRLGHVLGPRLHNLTALPRKVLDVLRHRLHSLGHRDLGPRVVVVGHGLVAVRDNGLQPVGHMLADLHGALVGSGQLRGHRVTDGVEALQQPLGQGLVPRLLGCCPVAVGRNLVLLVLTRIDSLV